MALDSIRQCDHFVQFYDLDEENLIRNVGRFLSGGLKDGEGTLVIAEQQHQIVFGDELESLGINVRLATEEGRLAYLNAEETLDRIILRGSPDPDAFATAIEVTIVEIAARVRTGVVRVYGEVVGLLWRAGMVTAAIELEELWNCALASGAFHLFCGYPIDILGSNHQPGLIETVFSAHSSVVSAGGRRLEAALDRAIREVIGERSVGSLITSGNWQKGTSVPKGEALALWVRKTMPRDADAVLNRARLYYRL